MDKDYIKLGILLVGLVMFALSIFGKKKIQHKCLMIGWGILIYYWVVYE
ncbi:MAG: hypothetical protein LBV03_04570 [Fusobacteriales bacterium]|jgi:hypothetical protein|nr:hypothetical protein [Fusobacteriales bacterium]